VRGVAVIKAVVETVTAADTLLVSLPSGLKVGVPVGSHKI
jgi:hypothetical protein